MKYIVLNSIKMQWITSDKNLPRVQSVCLRECIADMIKVALGIGNWQLRIWGYGTMQ